MGDFRVLVVNPGSTSTKVAVYEGDTRLFMRTIHHDSKSIAQFHDIMDQHRFRKNHILESLAAEGIDPGSLNAVVGRGGLCRPISGGVYLVNDEMKADLRNSVMGKHASSLGGLIADEIASEFGVPSYIVDPVVVDELEPLARVSGMPGIQRKSIFHALNQKAVARKAAKEMGKGYGEARLIVTHLGGGITVGVHRYGRVVDVNNGLDGEGPFAPERSGGLPVGDLVKLCFSGKHTEAEIMRMIAGRGGLVAYLGTNDGEEVEDMIINGSLEAHLYFEAMAYQVSKEIGAAATVLYGKVDGIVLTGGLAHSPRFVAWVRDRVEFIAPVLVYPGEDEMQALAEGALRVLRGEEKPREYKAR